MHGVAVPPIHSEILSQSIEINDVIRANEWTFNLGFVISNDKLYGQGLRAVDGNVSGFEVAPGNKYLMKEIDFTDMFQPRLGVTFSPNGKDALSASYAKYFPAGHLPPAGRIVGPQPRHDDPCPVRRRRQHDLPRPRGAPPRARSSRRASNRDPSTSTPSATTNSSPTRGRVASVVATATERTSGRTPTTPPASRYEPPEGIPQELYVPNLDEIRAEIGGSSYVIAALDGAYTKYYELGAEAEWRGRNGYFRGSYVWSHYYGNFDQDNSTNDNDLNIFIGSSNIADGAGRQLWNFREGNLRGDRRHQLKLVGIYQVPWNGSFGAFGVYQSGQPWETWSYEPYSNLTASTSDTNRYAEPAGINTSRFPLPDRSQLHPELPDRQSVQHPASRRRLQRDQQPDRLRHRAEDPQRRLRGPEKLLRPPALPGDGQDRVLNSVGSQPNNHGAGLTPGSFFVGAWGLRPGAMGCEL